MTQYRNVGSGGFLTGQKSSSECRPNAQEPKQVPGDQLAVQLPRLPEAGQREVVVAIGHEVLENVVLPPEVEEVRVRKILAQAGARISALYGDQLIGLGIGQRAEDYCIEHAEDSRIRSNTQGKSQDGDGGKSGCLQ